MEYLSLSEIQSRSAAISTSLEMLIRMKTIANKPDTKQWRFLRDCVRRLLSPGSESVFQNLSPVQAAQMKFEVEDRLKKFYLRPGKSVDMVFSIVHKSKLAMYGLPEQEEYPSLAGYAVLIRDISIERQAKDESPQDHKSYLERVIAECIDAEFRVYAALPELITDDLHRWFCKDSPAMKEIINLISRHQKKGWIISNTQNPSTKRLMSVKVKYIDQHEASVNTMEYWYLRWFDQNAGSYTYSYRETNRQMYILKKEPDGWKVYENLRPSPRTSIPHRWKNRKKA